VWDGPLVSGRKPAREDGHRGPIDSGQAARSRPDNHSTTLRRSCRGFRDFEPPLQGALHPSITLLVRYRFHACIVPCTGYTVLFKLQSQATLLQEAGSNALPDHGTQHRTGQYPCVVAHSRDIPGAWPTGHATRSINPQHLLNHTQAECRILFRMRSSVATSFAITEASAVACHSSTE